jgi:hypothetical protein
MDAAAGGDVTFLHYRIDAERALSLGARALFTVRLNTERESFPMYNADFRGGLALGYEHGRDDFEIHVFHESSHLGDEVLERGRRERIDYSREAVRLLWSREILENLRIYAGPRFNMRAFPSDIRHRLAVQAGAEYRFRGPRNLPMYAAIDLQARGENGWFVNTNAQLGLELTDPDRPADVRPRLFLEGFNGYSNMGQYFDERETWVLFGLSADL